MGKIFIGMDLEAIRRHEKPFEWLASYLPIGAELQSPNPNLPSQNQSAENS